MARKAAQTINENEVQETEPVVEKKTYKTKARKIDNATMITVKNGYNGMLVYRSKRTGEKFIWNGFGTEQEIEFGELKNAKNTSKMFFENGWFLIEDEEVIEQLGLKAVYENVLSFEAFDKLFELAPDEIEKKIKKISKGQRQSVAYRARQLIEEGKIDSIRVINTLEKSLGIELIER